MSIRRTHYLTRTKTTTENDFTTTEASEACYSRAGTVRPPSIRLIAGGGGAQDQDASTSWRFEKVRSLDAEVLRASSPLLLARCLRPSCHYCTCWCTQEKKDFGKPKINTVEFSLCFFWWKWNLFPDQVFLFLSGPFGNVKENIMDIWNVCR